MRRILLAGAGILPLVIVGACADSGDSAIEGAEGGLPEASAPDVLDATADRLDVDPRALRCSSDFCIVDLPNPGAYGFTKWSFAGIQTDPAIGVWAIANGVEGTDESTAQLLRFEGGAWKPSFAPSLGSGGGKRNLRLTSLAADGAGQLLAAGSAIDDGTPVIVRGDGSTFTATTTTFAMTAVWFAAPGDAWGTGQDGAIYHSKNGADWAVDRQENGASFTSIWGNGPDDIYVGGRMASDFSFFGYLGHRTSSDAGVKWVFEGFEDLQMGRIGQRFIAAGIAAKEGPRFWSSESVLAREATPDGGDAGGREWVADPYQPRAALHGFWSGAKNDIWAIGDFSRLLHFDGAEWKLLPLLFNGAPLTPHLTGIAGTSAGELFVVGEGVALRREAK